MNRGVSWTRINNLDRVTTCAFNPLNLNEAYLTTETTGLWNSTNITSATPSFTQVAGYPFRQPERVFFNPYKPSEIWVTSFGHGLMTANTVSASGSLPGTLQLDATTLGSNGTVALTLQQATPGASYAIQVSTNLSNWISLTTNMAETNGGLPFQHTNARGFTQPFFTRPVQLTAFVGHSGQQTSH